jgi:hypothetical protein
MRALVLLVAITACFGASAALAGPPFVTDDPEPVDPHHWEINTGVTYQNSGSGEVSGSAPFAEFNYGVVPNVQVTLGLPLDYTFTSGSHHSSYGGTEIGVKYRFVQETDNRPQIAFVPSVDIPSEAGGHVVTFLPLWLQKSSGPWTLYGGGGLNINPGPGNRDYTFFGGVLTRDVSPATTVGAELYYQGADTVDGTGTTGATLGVTSQIGAHHALLFSVGRSLNGASTAFSGYLAYRFILGPEEKK